MTESVLLAPTVLVQGLLIWASLRAKPLGDRPYRWATYVGITSGVLALAQLCFLVAVSNPSGSAILATSIALLALASAGILLRKRFGVIFFIFAYSALIWNLQRGANSAWQSSSVLVVVIVLICTTAYFKKRWALLGKS